MDGGHQTLFDAKLIVDDLGQRRQAVGGAGGIGDDGHIAGVSLVVDTHDEGGDAIALAGSGQDDLLGAAHEVLGAAFCSAELTGGFDDIFYAHAGPVDVFRLILAEHLDVLAVDLDAVLDGLDLALEPAEYRVVLKHIDHAVQVGVADVNGTDLETGLSGLQAAQNHSCDTAKAVDAYFNRCHLDLPLLPKNIFPHENADSRTYRLPPCFLSFSPTL